MPRHRWLPKERGSSWQQCANCECKRAIIKFNMWRDNLTYYKYPGGNVLSRAPSCVALSPLEKDISRYVAEQKAELGI